MPGGPKPAHPPVLTAKWRERIGVGKLLNLLEQHAEGKVRMNMSRIRAAEILLRKCLPDLSSMELKGEVGSTVRYYAAMPEKAKTAEEWLKGVPQPEEPATTH